MEVVVITFQLISLKSKISDNSQFRKEIKLWQVLYFEDSKKGQICKEELIIIKNRFCCPKDKEPLITILDKKVASYEMKITCKACESIYTKSRSIWVFDCKEKISNG